MPDGAKPTESMAPAWNNAWATGFEPMHTMNLRVFESWARGMSNLSHEMAQFMQSRLLEDSVMWEKLATCRDVRDVADCETRFIAKASMDYAEAAQKFSRLLFEVAGNCSNGMCHAPKAAE